jgi:hypothetical protein
MDYLIITLSFVLGIVASRIFTIAITWAQLIELVRTVEKDCLFMLASASESVAYIQTIKEKTMIDLNIDEKVIERSKSVDAHSFDKWKSAAVSNLHAAYPAKFRTLPKYYDWNTAMDFLNKVYFQNRNRIDKSDK